MFGRVIVELASATSVLVLGVASCFLSVHFALGQSGSAPHPSSTPTDSSWAPPSDAEIAERAQKLVANQHRDDEALKEFERIERHTDLTAGPNPRMIEDKLFRIVPTGSGTLRILLKENGTATDPAEYRRHLQAWQDVLELMLRTNDPRTQTAYEKYDRRNHQRAELGGFHARIVFGQMARARDAKRPLMRCFRADSQA